MIGGAFEGFILTQNCSSVMLRASVALCCDLWLVSKDWLEMFGTTENRLETHDALVDNDDLTSSISSSGKVWRDSLELNAENADLSFSAVGSLEQITGGPAGRGAGIKYLISPQDWEHWEHWEHQNWNKSNFLSAFLNKQTTGSDFFA